MGSTGLDDHIDERNQIGEVCFKVTGTTLGHALGVNKLDAKAIENIVTLFLVNDQLEPEARRDAAWIFQPELRVEAPDGAAIFRQRALAIPASDDPVVAAEEAALAMRYRDEVEFAVGHGGGSTNQSTDCLLRGV